ncbi:MAG: glucans biosynthesis glucosyltransferase MdoH [Gammaproteobacteria bacterium]
MCAPVPAQTAARRGGHSDRAVPWRRAAYMRRTVLTLLVLAQTLTATYYMVAVLPYHGGTGVEKGITALFALLFGWVSVGFWTAGFGFIVQRLGGDRFSLLRRHSPAELERTPLARTAVVMPIYHEPVDRCLQGLRAVYRSLERTGKLEHFDFFILSDSRDPQTVLAEQAGWYGLCEELNGGGRIYYRRRTLNLRYKSGNIADFLRRWGRRYEYMAVLDADSLVRGETLVRMVQLMEREPQVGILQTNPAIINARSTFARVQQFANRAYGKLLGAGLASIQLGEAAYWGHNAVIRIEPFMKHCGLRALRGFGVFKGPVLSHDFIEAAYMGRAGYEVWMETGLDGSYEESPPSVVDELARDRRWAKGNLQHLWLLLFGRRIRFAHRMAFLNGIMSYFSSPLWLAFLVLVSIETTRFVLWPINYFPSQHQLFPLWPQWHPEWALRLAVSTVVLLFLPKVLALLDLTLSRSTRTFGGPVAATASVVFESLVSSLLAPVRMLAHSRFVAGALLNISLHWGGQNRSAEIPWSAALITQAPATLIAGAWAGFAFWLKPLFFLWTLPVSLPLVLAAPTTVVLSRVRLGQRLRRAGLLLVPEELQGSPLLDDLHGDSDSQGPDRSLPLTPFEQALIDPKTNAIHAALAREPREGARRANLLAVREQCLQHGPEDIPDDDLARLVKDRESLLWLHHRIWRAPPDNYWGRRLEVHVIGCGGNPAKG